MGVVDQRKGFTLIELLVVIAIISVLATLATAALLRGRAAGDKAAAASQMRQIGAGLLTYCGENDGYLPGPLKVGQGALYDPAIPDQLATRLGTYLGVTDLENKVVVPVFLPPAYVRELKLADPADSQPYFLNMSTRSADGTQAFPWGDSKKGNLVPLPLANVPDGAWVLADADQLLAEVGEQPWANRTPKRIIHAPERLALYFDGSVSGISQKELEDAPPSGGGPGPGPGGGPPPPPPPPPPRK